MTGTTRRRVVGALCAAGALALVAPPPARAQSLDQLRASGTVGERYDGYAAIRGDATPAVRALVERVNAERRRIYQSRAAEQKVPADQVGRVYAKTIWQNSPSGTWFLDADGKWVRK